MSHEPYAELASGYALTALGDDDRARFEGHLRAGCHECEALLTNYTHALAGVARELPRTAPPPEVRARLLQRVAAEPVRREVRDVREVRAVREIRPVRRRPLWPIVAAASLAAAAGLLVYLGVTIGELRQEARARVEEVAALRAEVARQRELGGAARRSRDPRDRAGWPRAEPGGERPHVVERGPAGRLLRGQRAPRRSGRQDLPALGGGRRRKTHQRRDFPRGSAR